MAFEALSESGLASRLARAEAYLGRQQVEKNLAAAKLSHLLLEEILGQLAPGMKESDGRALALECFSRRGIEKTWHPPYVRFGKHTLLTFLDKADEDCVLQEEDIAFVDIGIVYEGVEGDAGRTRVFGRNPHFSMLKDASEGIFAEARAFWRERSPTGIALYEYIRACAERRGLFFALDPAGHLIGEFPHAGWKRGINHFPQAIEAGKWILEIQLRDAQGQYGAFYENLLY